MALGGPKARALLAVLLIHRNQVVSRERLVDDLWGERPPQTVAVELRVYVAKLRKALRPGLLLTHGEGYSLELDGDQLDADRFEQAAREGSDRLAAGDAEAAARILAEALALWRGGALGDLASEPWAQAEAGRLEELRQTALEERLEADLALGLHARVAAELERLVAEQPYRERLRGQLMLALYRCGRQSEALELYRQTARVFSEELGIEPGPELRARERAILNHDPTLRIRELAAGNLPAPPTRLIGRVRELTELSSLLSRPETRLVTVTGPAGSGKTRLTLELAAHLEQVRDVPAYLVELAPIADKELVLPTIARVVELDDDGRKPLPERLGAFLRHRRLLLVLDNFEHLVDAAPVVARLLAAAPHLTVLATSRAPLHLRAEWRYELGPLTIDDAVQLFVERARAVGRVVEPDPNVGLLCQRLDGLPLAIELAAARVDVLAPTELLAALSRRFDVLTTGSRDAPEHQRTLRAMLDWSYQLLDEQEQNTFNRLSVFAGGCTLDAAKEICNATAATMAALVDKSLLRCSGGRYAMLETIREYASERLHERGLTEAVVRALAAYLLGLVMDDDGGLGENPPPAAVREQLPAELDNLRAAVAWALEAHDADLALRLAIGGIYFTQQGVDLEHAQWIDEAFRMGTSVAATTRARALRRLGEVAYGRGAFGEAAMNLEQSLRICREKQDDLGAVRDLHMLGVIAGDLSDVMQARALLRQSLDLARQVADRRGVYLALASLGRLEHKSGNLSRASVLLDEAVRRIRRADIPHQLAQALMSAGKVALAQRDASRAAELYAEALPLCTRLGMKRDATNGLFAFAALAALAGNVERVGRLCGAVENLEQAPDYPALFAHQRPKYEEIETCADEAPDAFAAARERGRLMSLEEAAAYAIEGPSQASPSDSRSSMVGATGPDILL